MANPKQTAIKKRTVRARVRGSSLDLLDVFPLRDGEEVLISIREGTAAKDLDALGRAAGGWKDMVDADALVADIYADRLLSTRPSPRV